MLTEFGIHHRLESCGDKTENKTKIFSVVTIPAKLQIMDQLESAVSETGKTVLFGKVENLYHVTYPPAISSNRVDRPKEQLLCEALKINTSTFLSGNPFFENQQLGSYLPSKPLSLIAQGMITPCGSTLDFFGCVLKIFLPFRN